MKVTVQNKTHTHSFQMAPTCSDRTAIIWQTEMQRYEVHTHIILLWHTCSAGEGCEHVSSGTETWWMQPGNWQQVSMDFFHLAVYWISPLPLLRQGIETSSDIKAETDALIVFAPHFLFKWFFLSEERGLRITAEMETDTHRIIKICFVFTAKDSASFCFG